MINAIYKILVRMTHIYLTQSKSLIEGCISFFFVSSGLASTLAGGAVVLQGRVIRGEEELNPVEEGTFGIMSSVLHYPFCMRVNFHPRERDCEL